MIVDRVPARRRVLDALVIHQVPARKEIIDRSRTAPVFETLREGSAASAIRADGAARLLRTRSRRDVDEARSVQPVLRRQGSGDKRQIADEARLEHIAKTGNAVRKQNAVDAILQVGVVVAHVKLTACCRILADARRLQRTLIERRLRPLRQRLDRLFAK